MSSPFSLFDYHKLAIPEDLVAECAQLFSNYYGVWAEEGHKPVHKVQLGPARLTAQCLFDTDTCRVVIARHITGELVGQAFYCSFMYKSLQKKVVWITQLVVKEEFRGCHLARKLLTLACEDKGLFACCLVSCHPYAVLALESALGKKCDLAMTALHAKAVVQDSKIAYTRDKAIEVSVGGSLKRSVVQTNYHVSHCDVDARRAALPSWHLGPLHAGEEYLAMVFPGS